MVMTDAPPKLFRVLLVYPEKGLAYLTVSPDEAGAIVRVFDRLFPSGRPRIGVQALGRIPIDFDREVIVAESTYDPEWETSAEWL